MFGKDPCTAYRWGTFESPKGFSTYKMLTRFILSGYEVLQKNNCHLLILCLMFIHLM